MLKNKKCPKCHGTKICSHCGGSGELRIINSRSKGNTYERKIAKMFSEWAGFEIRRTPSSGALLKSGDICPLKPEHMVSFPFSVELKNRKSWGFNNFFSEDPNKGVFEFWVQCVSDSKKSEKIPMLVFTKNGEPNYGMMDSADYARVIKVLFVSSLMVGSGYTVFLLSDLFQLEYKKIEKAAALSKGD